MRLIDADALYKTLAWEFYQSSNAINDIGNSILGKVYKTIIDAPTIDPERKKGKWIDDNCSLCGQYVYHGDIRNFCPNCGADMRTPVEIARDIVHTAIDNSVWSDTVDVSEMHKVIDDKYAEMEGQDDE